MLERRVKGLKDEDHVFTYQARGRKELWNAQKIAYRLEKACRGAKIPYADKVFNQKGERIGIVFHCFRHTRISKWVEMGFSDEIVRRASGHKNLDAFKRYVHLGPSSVMMLVEKGDKNVLRTPQRVIK